MVLGTGASSFPSGQFASSALLKFLQESGSQILWAEQSGLDSILTKKGKNWDNGKARTYSLTVDGGFAGIGGLNFTSGTFMPGDRASTIQGILNPKFQTHTLQYQRMLNSFTKGDAAAYLNHLRLETETKAMGLKSMNANWLLLDGTGRVGTPVGFGASDAATGASFTLTDPATPLKVKLSALSSAVGNAVNFFEGMVISFLFPSYDENNDGTEETTNADCPVRYLTLEFVAGSTKSYYDAFRVVEIDVRNNAIYLVPARESAPAGASYAPTSAYAPNETYVQKQGQTTMWCAGSGTVTVKPYLGMTTANAIPGTLTAIPDLAVLLDPVTQFTNAATTVGFFAFPTNHVPSGVVDYGMQNSDFSTYTSTQKTNAETARAMLGFGWTSSTAVDLINPYVPTGLMTMLLNRSNVVNGISRASIRQLLPTQYDCASRPLTLNEMLKFVTDHINRNKNKIPEWNLLLMGTLAYESMVTQSELDRRITETKGIRGEDQAKVFKFEGKQYQFEAHTAMRSDYIFALPKGLVELHGGESVPVTAGGVSEFLSLANGRRINQAESYNTMIMEYCLRQPRAGAFMQNFTLN